VVQFYPWFNSYFPLFLTHYHTLPYTKTKGKKIELRIKLNHNIHMYCRLGYVFHPGYVTFGGYYIRGRGGGIVTVGNYQKKSNLNITFLGLLFRNSTVS